MSPRTTDVPGQDVHALPTAAAVRAPFDDAYTSKSGVSIQPQTGSDADDSYRRNRITLTSTKPLSSGFKSLAWMKPAADNLCLAPVTIKEKKVTQRSDSMPIKANVAPYLPSPTTKEQRQRQGASVSARPILKTRRRNPGERYYGDSNTTFSPAKPHQCNHGDESSSIFHSVPPQQQSNFHEELHEQGYDGQHLPHQSVSNRWSASFAVTPESRDLRVTTIPELDAAQRVWSRVLPRRECDPLESSLPDTRLYLAEESDVCIERSLSDSSIATASDFGTPRVNLPTILHEISDYDAMQGLLSLCSKGKGLQVVKHAGYGGGKSRKYMKYIQAEQMLVFSGVLPPYVKTRIPIQDIDRAEAKWCTVVLHAKKRPAPLLLEVDSISTASVVKAGLMVAARDAEDQQTMIEQKSPIETPAPALSHTRRDSLESDNGLAVVRPGHRASAVYDHDAALNVAALLAKEMEEERAALSGPDGRLSKSCHDAVQPTFDVQEERAVSSCVTGGGDICSVTTPIIPRSFSMSSMVNTVLPTPNPTPSRPDRRSLPNPQVTLPSENLMPAVDAAAALGRLHNTTGGRGLLAIKRKTNGKGRSRVLVQSRMQASTIGWIHVLPPFSRKNIPFKNLLGATRSLRVVTLKFRHRDPVMLEPDRLTDAIILEQGFTCLANSAKTPA